MNAEEFKAFWAARYPNTNPVSHSFKHDLHDRWFRIHSLPASKRYADTDEEWTLLLARQNQVLTDLLGENAPVLLVTGDFVYQGQDAVGLWPEVESLSGFPFTALDQIDMHQHKADEYVEGWTYRPKFCETTWAPGDFDALLRDIADDRTRAIFISVERDVLAAPYDGGIDFVMKDRAERSACKAKYKEWLSARADGL